jgi:predicted nucleic acid-binding protein
VSLVLDCSVTLAWLLPDEQSAPAHAVLDRIVASRAWVPALWRLEVANSLQMAVRRNRIDRGFRDASLADLGMLNVQIDPDTSGFAWTDTLQLADTHGLTTYDAAYLELALRLSLPLATQDVHLRRAALDRGVPLLGM